MIYKNYKIEYQTTYKKYLAYPNNEFKENGVFDTLELAKNWIIQDIKIKESNNKSRLEREKREAKAEAEKKEKNKYVNEFMKQFDPETLQTQKLKHYLLNDIKTRFTVKNIDYMANKNHLQIEYLNELGYKAIKEDGKYRAYDDKEVFFSIKKSEFIFLEWLNKKKGVC